jgi:addiction module HigA family antidote
MRRPRHPGEVLRREYVVRRGMSGRELSRALGVANSRLAKVLNAELSVTPDLALRLSKASGRTAGAWMSMQMNYDLWKARQEVDLRGVRRLRGRRRRGRRG